MTTKPARADAPWTLDESWLLDHYDPERKGESLMDLIIRSSRLPRRIGKEDLTWMI